MSTSASYISPPFYAASALESCSSEHTLPGGRFGGDHVVPMDIDRMAPMYGKEVPLSHYSFAKREAARLPTELLHHVFYFLVEPLRVVHRTVGRTAETVMVLETVCVDWSIAVRSLCREVSVVDRFLVPLLPLLCKQSVRFFPCFRRFNFKLHSRKDVRKLCAQATFLSDVQDIEMSVHIKAPMKLADWEQLVAVPFVHRLVTDLQLSNSMFFEQPFLLPRALRSLNLSCCTHLADGTVTALMATCSQLEVAMFCFCWQLREPLIRSGSLRKLSFSHCNGLLDSAVTYLFANCPQLQEVDMSSCSQLHRPSIASASLRTLNLLHCSHLSNETIDEMFLRCPNVAYVCLNYCRQIWRPRFGGALETVSGHGCSNLQDDAVTQLFQDAPRLRDANFSGCASLVSPTLRSGSLTSCNLSYCNLLTDAAAESMFQHCPRLSEAVLSFCSSLTRPTLNSATITRLTLSCCIGLTDQAVSTCLRLCPKLADVDLSGCSQLGAPEFCSLSLKRVNLHGCLRLRDAAVTSLFRGCPNLTNVDVSFCVQLANPVLESQSVERVNAHNCCRLSDLAVTNMFRYCLNLRDVNLFECQQLRQPIMRSPSVEKLNLSCCVSLAEDTVNDMLDYCLALRELHLSFCTQLRVLHLPSHPALEKLFVYGCGNLVKDCEIFAAADRQSSNLRIFR